MENTNIKGISEFPEKLVCYFDIQVDAESRRVTAWSAEIHWHPKAEIWHTLFRCTGIRFRTWKATLSLLDSLLEPTSAAVPKIEKLLVTWLLSCLACSSGAYQLHFKIHNEVGNRSYSLLSAVRIPTGDPDGLPEDAPMAFVEDFNNHTRRIEQLNHIS